MDPISFLIFGILFLLSWFFSWTEIALMSLPNHKIESLIRQWKAWSIALKHIKNNNERLLITILIWNNLVNVYTASLATSISIEIAEKSWLEQSLAIWISTWVITLLLLMFWEIAPKTFATKNAEKISLMVAQPYKILMFILAPIVIIIELINKIFTWKHSEEIVTNEEIEAFIDMWKNSGTLEDWKHEKLKNILWFWERSVEEIMTPRVKIDAMEQNTTIDDAVKYTLKHTHSRIPIYDYKIDRITSVISTRELLKEYHNWNWDKKLKDLSLSKAIKVPVNQPIDTLLETFRKSYKHIAIIIDEYGWVAWLVTLEDVIEEVFGDIKDETDDRTEEIQKIWNNEYIVQPNVLVDEILDLFELNFDDIWIDKHTFDWENISYLITAELERFPSPWEKIEFNITQKDEYKEENKSLVIKVRNISNFKIDTVEVKIKNTY